MLCVTAKWMKMEEIHVVFVTAKWMKMEMCVVLTDRAGLGDTDAGPHHQQPAGQLCVSVCEFVQSEYVCMRVCVCVCVYVYVCACV